VTAIDDAGPSISLLLQVEPSEDVYAKVVISPVGESSVATIRKSERKAEHLGVRVSLAPGRTTSSQLKPSEE
jgi:hypothetical protein